MGDEIAGSQSSPRTGASGRSRNDPKPSRCAAPLPRILTHGKSNPGQIGTALNLRAHPRVFGRSKEVGIRVDFLEHAANGTLDQTRHFRLEHMPVTHDGQRLHQEIDPLLEVATVFR
jgi:hypothetical protein